MLSNRTPRPLWAWLCHVERWHRSGVTGYLESQKCSSRAALRHYSSDRSAPQPVVISQRYAPKPSNREWRQNTKESSQYRQKCLSDNTHRQNGRDYSRRDYGRNDGRNGYSRRDDRVDSRGRDNFRNDRGRNNYRSDAYSRNIERSERRDYDRNDYDRNDNRNARARPDDRRDSDRREFGRNNYNRDYQERTVSERNDTDRKDYRDAAHASAKQQLGRRSAHESSQTRTDEPEAEKSRRIPKLQALPRGSKSLRYVSRHAYTQKLVVKSGSVYGHMIDAHVKHRADEGLPPLEEDFDQMFQLRLQSYEEAIETTLVKFQFKLLRRISRAMYPIWEPPADFNIGQKFQEFMAKAHQQLEPADKKTVELSQGSLQQFLNASSEDIFLKLDLPLLKAYMQHYSVAPVRFGESKLYDRVAISVMLRTFVRSIVESVLAEQKRDPTSHKAMSSEAEAQPMENDATIKTELVEPAEQRPKFFVEPTDEQNITPAVISPVIPTSDAVKVTRGLVELSNPAWLFPQARAIHRKIYLHIGPTNSGKTYNALQAFQKAKTGFYAGPLRLLAREVYTRMNASGNPCNLVTGEEVIDHVDASGQPAGLSSGTVEMMDVNNRIDVAVIDEIQMISDPDRGWAWTQALLAVQATEVHLCGDPNTEKVIRKIVEQTGDSLEVVRYQRLSPLKLEPEIFDKNLKGLKPGDCIVFFSKKHILAAKEIIERQTGEKCAIIYGSLPAETRQQQAALFNDPESGVNYLVASDAIGMGLNLAIRRVVFARTLKFDGSNMTQLPIAQVKQIAGRAGRYQVAPSSSTPTKPEADSADSVPEKPVDANVGYVAAVSRKDRKMIENSLKKPSPSVRHVSFFPPDYLIEQFAHSLGPEVTYDKVLDRLQRVVKLPDLYQMADLSNMILTAGRFSFLRGLLPAEKMTLAKAPVSSSDSTVRTAFTSMCQVIANSQSRSITDILYNGLEVLSDERPNDPRQTDALESAHRVIGLFLWLSYRFPTNFLDRQGARQLKALCEERINGLLSQGSALSKQDVFSGDEEDEALDELEETDNTEHNPDDL